MLIFNVQLTVYIMLTDLAVLPPDNSFCNNVQLLQVPTQSPIQKVDRIRGRERLSFPL